MKEKALNFLLTSFKAVSYTHLDVYKRQEYFKNLENQLKEVSSLLKSKDLVKSIEKLLEENAALKSEVEALKKEKAKGEINDWKNAFVQKGNKQLLVCLLYTSRCV